MARSWSQLLDLDCPACGQPFKVDVWLIVDAVERPDLAAAVADRSLHDISCPNCGQTGAVPAPLLYHDQQARAVLFAVPAGSDEQGWREQLEALLWTLIGALPEAERLPYLSEVQVEQGIDGLAQALTELEQAPPIDEQQIPALAEAVMALIDASDAHELEQVLARYPFLLEPAMGQALEELAQAAEQQGERQVADAFRHGGVLLGRLRTVLDAAAAEQAARDRAEPPERTAEPPASWAAALAELQRPDQQAELLELVARHPVLADRHAPLWIEAEIERQRDQGNLGTAQLLIEWLWQLRDGSAPTSEPGQQGL